MRRNNKYSYCQCQDRDCPVHLGSVVCGRIPTGLVIIVSPRHIRIVSTTDTAEDTGTPMCDKCAEDACKSGDVFDWRDYD